MIIHPDPRLTVCRVLRGVLPADVFVGVTLPDPRPDRSVTVRCDGGRRLDVLRKRYQIAVNVRALELVDASELSELVSSVLWEASGDHGITRVRVSISGQDVPDEAPVARLYSAFEVDLRGAPS